MSKQKKRRKKKPARPKNHTQTVLDIIKTDSTFELFSFGDGTQVWVGKCIHCNARMTVGLSGDTGFTIEHIIPQYAGGGNDLKNLALACGGCNSEKGIRHDTYVGKTGRADEVSSLQAKRLSRWREP